MLMKIFGYQSCYSPWFWALVALLLVGDDGSPARAAEKKTLGAVEDVVVLPWNIKLLARIDTGAGTSSLDARDIRVKNNKVEFKLIAPGGAKSVTLPLVEWQNIRTSEGRERRPVVRLQLCISTQLVSTLVNLNDRSQMNYPLLIGRNTLARLFLVDVSRRKLLPPNCARGHAR